MDFSADWYPLALADGIEPGTSTGTQLFGGELVVWRDAEGASHVWEDRCPHRGMRLSFGFVRADRIACLYHGWQFDQAGQCRYIPAHPNLDVPETIKVSTYASVERAGMIWARPASTEEPSTPEDRAGLTSIRSLYLDRPLGAVLASLKGLSLPAHDGSALTFAGQDGALATFRSASAELVIGLQPFARDRSALHVLAAGDLSAEARAHYATALEALRRALESAPVAAVEVAA